MVKRETERNTLASLEEKDMINVDDDDEKDENNAEFRLVKSRRNKRMYEQSKLSPVPVDSAVNYKKDENKGWVKPLFSSIVYRLPVSHEYRISPFYTVLLTVLVKYAERKYIGIKNVTVH